MKNNIEKVIIENHHDDKLVNEAIIKIKEIYSKHAYEFYSELSEYLFVTFFNGDIELLRKKTPANDKKESFHMLFKRLKDEDPRLPGKSLSYNLLKIKVQELEYKDDEKLFQTYGNLSLSHKTELLKVSDPNKKRELISNAHEKNYSVRSLRKEINEMRAQKTKLHKPISFPKCIENIKLKIEEWKTQFDQYTNTGTIQDDASRVIYKIKELEQIINSIKI